MDAYELGRQGERAVKRDLESRFPGARVELSPGSRSKTDVEAFFPRDNLLWFIQVKSAILPQKPVWLNEDEQRGLNSRASKHGAVPIVAWVWFDNTLRFLMLPKIEYFFSDSNRTKVW